MSTPQHTTPVVFRPSGDYSDDGRMSDAGASESGFSELLENYSLNLMPQNSKFKLRKYIGNQLVVGATCSAPVHPRKWPLGRPSVSIMVKPQNKTDWWGRFWSKAEVSPRHVNVRSDKLTNMRPTTAHVHIITCGDPAFTVLKYFRLQMELGYGQGIASPLRWRIDTIWNPHKRLLHKQYMTLHSGKKSSLELRPHFGVDMHLPAVEGGMGASHEEDVDVGRCHVDLPLVELVHKF